MPLGYFSPSRADVDQRRSLPAAGEAARAVSVEGQPQGLGLFDTLLVGSMDIVVGDSLADEAMYQVGKLATSCHPEP